MKPAKCSGRRAAYLLPVALLVGGVTAAWVGEVRWRQRTAALQTRLQKARNPLPPGAYSESELSNPPAPVQRYFRAVLTEGQPRVAAARFAHEGTFNMGEASPNWRPFVSRQVVTTCPPGFDWEGRIGSGVSVSVHDAYVGGEGILRAELLRVIPVVDVHGTPEAAQGELMRYLAEAAWYPTALLPAQGVRWEAIDDNAARATLTDRDVTAALEFRFDGAGLITEVYSPARFRTVAGQMIPTPWQGRFWDYGMRHGMKVPLQGEVGWETPDGFRPYWRGRLTEIAYEFAG